MKDQLISFKTAKLAKEKGFDLYVKYFYKIKNSDEYEIVHNGHMEYDWNDSFQFNPAECSAPTQSLLQRWIREKYNNHIAIMPHLIPSNKVKYYVFKHRLGVKSFEELFDSYEDALESALYESLLLI